MKKQIFSLALALTMVLTLLPGAIAAGSGSCGAGVSWTLDDSGKLTISGSGAMTDFVSSSQVPWYDRRSDIIAILVEDGVTHVGANAFLNCLSVTTVHMATSVSSIGDSAFASCGSPSYGPSISLPIGLSSVDSYAFMGCNMRYLSIPYGVTAIGEYAFSGCTRFTEVSIPSTVTQIGSHAFEGCSALTSVAFQDVPDRIGYRAFYGLPAGAEVSFNGTQAQWDNIAAEADCTTEELIFGSGSTVPTVRFLVDTPTPAEPVTLTFADRANRDGVVELDADHPSLSATLTAPIGAKLTGWTLRLYTEDGAYITAVEDNRRGTISQSPSTLSYTLWKTPSGREISFSDFSLTLGETYQYELSAVVDETVYTTGRGRFRPGSAPQTYTVSFCNPVNMTYSDPIQVVSGQPYGKLPTPTMPGKAFDGWYTAGNEKVTASTIADLTRDQTLYAHWTQEAPITLTRTNRETGGVVELSAQSAELTATLSAPKGRKVSRWEVILYTTDGDVVGRVTHTEGGSTTGEDVPFSLRLWTVSGTPTAGQLLDYKDFRLTVGTTYEYEFTATVEGETYTTGRARFRLSAAGSPSGGTAYASTQSVLVDGSSVVFQAYALKDADGYDTNYVKLRDVAQILNGTAAQFEVGWDGAVTIETGKGYTSNGTEMRTPFSGNRSYTPAAAPTLVNGRTASLEAILLQDDAGNGYTYYKLRDLGTALGFRVDWTAEKGIFIETK